MCIYAPGALEATAGDESAQPASPGPDDGGRPRRPEFRTEDHV